MNIRQSVKSDVPEMCGLLNRIIEIGGTTAYQEILTEEKCASHFLDNPNCLSSYVCHSEDDQVLGFQSLFRNARLDSGWGDIATFARVKPKVKGVGTALFQTTLELAQRTDIVAINATIRADNVSGLSYYSKMGFVDYAIDKAVALNDGTPVDRISKKYIVTQLRD